LLKSLTIRFVAENISSNTSYKSFADILSSRAISENYASESVEAEILHFITANDKKYSKIIIFAGYNHVRNLDNYLSLLDFSKVKSAGSDAALAQSDFEIAQIIFRNSVDQDHASRVSPLDPLDHFGQQLF